jgi:L-2-hydroxycarboxylate dehydrogenase (NAD+)
VRQNHKLFAKRSQNRRGEGVTAQSSSNPSPFRPGKGISHFFGAIEIDGFIDKDEFKSQIDDWIHVFRNTKAAPDTNGPLIPGDRERAAEATCTTGRIPLRRPGVNDLLDNSRKTGRTFAAI